MSKKNYHAYKDYHGPRIPGTKRPHNTEDALRGDDDDDTDENPLGALAWSEGDSLAPPCGSSVPLIHAMLDFASVNQEDVLYDVSGSFSPSEPTALHVLSYHWSSYRFYYNSWGVVMHGFCSRLQ